MPLSVRRRADGADYGQLLSVRPTQPEGAAGSESRAGAAGSLAPAAGAPLEECRIRTMSHPDPGLRYLSRIHSYCQRASAGLLSAGFEISELLGRDSTITYKRGTTEIIFDSCTYQLPIVRLCQVRPARFREQVLRVSGKITKSQMAKDFYRLRDNANMRDFLDELDRGRFDWLMEEVLDWLAAEVLKEIDADSEGGISQDTRAGR